MSLFSAIAFFAALALFCLGQGLFWILRGRKQEREEALLDRLRVMREEEDVKVTRDLPGELRGFLAKFEKLKNLGIFLSQAGIDMSVQSFVTLCATFVVGVFLLALVLTGSLGGGVLVGTLMAAGLYLYMTSRRDKRLNQIDSQLPKSLELMMIGLRAGHTLEDTIRFAAEELSPPLSQELQRCYDEYALGRPIEQALGNLSERLAPCRALRTFVESVLVLKSTGGNLIEIIEQIIDSLRAQAAFEARFRALTSEGRTSGIILGALPLFVLAIVLLVQPTYVGSLLDDSAGQIVLLIAISMWTMGILWLIKLVKPSM